MKQLDFNTLDQIAKSNLSIDITQQTLHNIQIVQVPTVTGFLPQPVVLPVMENVYNRQAQKQEQRPPQIPQAAQYYLAINNEQKGPFTLAQIKDFLSAGLIKDHVLCWAPGFNDWTSIANIQELNK